MNVIVLGAGIIGTSTAWYLLERGHDVTVVDRQPAAARETTFANAAQISVSYGEPWANRHAPAKMIKWMFSREAPLLFRPRADWRQWRWGLRFLAQCNDRAFERNVRQIVALANYSHDSLKDVVRATGIEYQRLERGIAHYFTDEAAFDDAHGSAELMRRYGVERRVVSTAELLAIEPAFKSFAHRIVGGTYTPSDESGDARVFTEQLAARCQARGARFRFGIDVERLLTEGGALAGVRVRPRAAPLAGAESSPTEEAQSGGREGGGVETLKADAVVVACGSWSAPLLRTAGVDLSIYPGKGYSATFPILKPEAAPYVSTIDDAVKCAMSRLGDTLRVAGTIELSGYDNTLATPLAKARCRLLAKRIEAVLPGVCDTRLPEEGGDPKFWAGLRPATPTNIPFIGRTKVDGLWVNAGHGTLGWTHGAGSGRAMAELISGVRPAIDFGFLGAGGGLEASRVGAAPIVD